TYITSPHHRQTSAYGSPDSSRCGAHRHLHSFPTRRSSDLACRARESCNNIMLSSRKHGAKGINDDEFSVCAQGQWKKWFWIAFKDRKSTRLNSSHVKISYAVFCLKKKKKET